MIAMTSAEIFEICSSTGDASNEAFLKCVTDQLLLQDEADRQFSRTIYLIYSAALIFFMQAGKFECTDFVVGRTFARSPPLLVSL